MFQYASNMWTSPFYDLSQQETYNAASHKVVLLHNVHGAKAKIKDKKEKQPNSLKQHSGMWTLWLFWWYYYYNISDRVSGQ